MNHQQYRWKNLNTFEFTDVLAEILPSTGSERLVVNQLPTDTMGAACLFIFEGSSQALAHIFISEALTVPFHQIFFM